MLRGNADFFPGYWDPMGRQYIEKFDKTEKIEIIGSMMDNLKQGILIDKKTSDQYGIKTYEDLKNNAYIFQGPAEERAPLIGCEHGWFCNENLKAIIKTYELDEYHLKIGSYGSLISNVIAKYHDGTPVLYCAWELHWVHHHLKIGKDVVWLKDGSNHFKSNHLKILANKAFINAHPNIK